MFFYRQPTGGGGNCRGGGLVGRCSSLVVLVNAFRLLIISKTHLPWPLLGAITPLPRVVTLGKNHTVLADVIGKYECEILYSFRESTNLYVRNIICILKYLIIILLKFKCLFY